VPAKSKAQARFMRAALSGTLKSDGPSKSIASEFVSGVPTKGLPERIGSSGVTGNPGPTRPRRPSGFESREGSKNYMRNNPTATMLGSSKSAGKGDRYGY